jgi:hypothetical protein
VGASKWNGKAGNGQTGEGKAKDIRSSLVIFIRETLLQCLLDIHEWMMETSDRSSRIPLVALADDFAEYLCEVSQR